MMMKFNNRLVKDKISQTDRGGTLDADETFASRNPSFEGTWEGPPEIAFDD